MATAKEIDRHQPLRFDSEEEFTEWCDEDTNAEYVDGEVIIMPSPAALVNERLLSWLGSLLGMFIEKNDLGSLFCAGHCQVRLRPRLRRNPDIVFVAQDYSPLLRETYIDGAPDLIVEFVSPESTVRYWHDKFKNYEAAGVREYWIIDSHLQRVDVNALGKDGRFHLVEEKDGKVFSKVLSGFWIKPSWLWQSPLPRVTDVAKEIGIILG